MPKKLSKFSFYSYNSRSTFRIQVQAKIELNKQMRNVSEITTKGAAGKNNNGSAMREKCREHKKKKRKSGQARQRMRQANQAQTGVAGGVWQTGKPGTRGGAKLEGAHLENFSGAPRTISCYKI